MSRGFVREDDQEEPVFILPRAPLPRGLPNHVTPRGFGLLLKERESLERARGGVQRRDEVARRHELAVINGGLDLLNERIASARVVEPDGSPRDEVRFGTTVTILTAGGPQDGAERTFTLVGVDEASITEGRIAFVAPIARVLLRKRVGDVVEFTAGGRMQSLEVKKIV